MRDRGMQKCLHYPMFNHPCKWRQWIFKSVNSLTSDFILFNLLYCCVTSQEWLWILTVSFHVNYIKNSPLFFLPFTIRKTDSCNSQYHWASISLEPGISARISSNPCVQLSNSQKYFQRILYVYCCCCCRRKPHLLI